MKKQKVNGTSIDRDQLVKDICEVIETMFDPLRMLYSSAGASPSDFADIYCLGYEFAQLNPTYEKHEQQYKTLIDRVAGELQGAEDCDDTVGKLRLPEHDAFFAIGVLFGIKLAGKPMSDIEAMAKLMVGRQIRDGEKDMAALEDREKRRIKVG